MYTSLSIYGNKYKIAVLVLELLFKAFRESTLSLRLEAVLLPADISVLTLAMERTDAGNYKKRRHLSWVIRHA